MISNNQDISAIDILKRNPEIFRLLIRSDYLAAKEYGKLLLLTSKSLTKACFVREEVYDWLCRSRWGESARKMIDGMGISPYNCFILLQKQKSRRPNVPYLDIRPLKYSPEDYRLVITVFDDHGYPRVSKFLHGQDITPLFEVGSLSLDGLRDVALSAKKKGSEGNSNPFHKWKATVHVFRIPDQKSLCLYHSDQNASLKGMCLSFCINNDPLQMNDGYGLQLLECRDTISFDCRNYEGIVFNFSMGLCMESNGTVILDEDFDSSSNEYDVFFNSIHLDAFVMDNYGNISTMKFPKKMGKTLTFAHILENFYGWQN
jgi:hypothetical protein